MNKVILILTICSFSFGQEHGYVKFDAEEIWVIEINDTLIISEDVVKIESGVYRFKSRPQISYSWPSISVESEIKIEPGDTTYFQLAAHKSIASNVNSNPTFPKTTSYKELNYHPNLSRYPKLKTGLLITSIAANWLAFYLKREADNNYNKYGQASSNSDINKFYDRASNFDNASSVALTISAMALTGYIYIALTE